MPFPAVTALYAALCALLLLALTVQVILHRRRTKVGLGDGGDRGLLKAIRAHGNASETIPIQLLLLLLLELAGLAAAVVHGLGATILVSRLLHAIGLSRSSGPSPGRMIGMLLSLLLSLGMPLLLLWMLAMRAAP
jgi:uncharacterized protein